MRIYIPCMECFRIDSAPSRDFKVAEYHDSGIYETTCGKGHQTRTILNEQKWEVLSNVAAFALDDGYYREAVASFAACLERFHEFFLRAVTHQKAPGKFEEAWPSVSNQSERQLGAFIFMWLGEFGEVPAIPDRKQVEFRNKVIHKGHLPDRAEAMWYGECIYHLIRSQIEIMQSRLSGPMGQVIRIEMAKKRSEPDRLISLSIPTLLSLSSSMKQDFPKALSDLYEGSRRSKRT